MQEIGVLKIRFVIHIQESGFVFYKLFVTIIIYVTIFFLEETFLSPISYSGVLSEK